MLCFHGAPAVCASMDKDVVTIQKKINMLRCSVRVFQHQSTFSFCQFLCVLGLFMFTSFSFCHYLLIRSAHKMCHEINNFDSCVACRKSLDMFMSEWVNVMAFFIFVLLLWSNSTAYEPLKSTKRYWVLKRLSLSRIESVTMCLSSRRGEIM